MDISFKFNNIVFLPIIIFIGIVTSYEDLKISKIKNKWILFGLIYSFIIYISIWIFYKLGLTNSLLLWNFNKWCINLLNSCLVAYLLWHFKMWAAGDAKLFICYSALIPMGKYSKVYFNYYFASFLLLLCIFLPATIFLFLRAIFYFLKRGFKIKQKTPHLIKEHIAKVNLKECSKVLCGFFIFFLFFRIIRQELNNFMGKFLQNQNFLILISLLVFKPLSKFFKRSFYSLILIFIILLIYAWFKIEFIAKGYLLLMLKKSLLNSVIVIILFPVVRKTMNAYIERSINKTTPFAIWMFIGALITWFI